MAHILRGEFERIITSFLASSWVSHWTDHKKLFRILKILQWLTVPFEDILCRMIWYAEFIFYGRNLQAEQDEKRHDRYAYR